MSGPTRARPQVSTYRGLYLEDLAFPFRPPAADWRGNATIPRTSDRGRLRSGVASLRAAPSTALHLPTPQGARTVGSLAALTSRQLARHAPASGPLRDCISRTALYAVAKFAPVVNAWRAPSPGWAARASPYDTKPPMNRLSFVLSLALFAVASVSEAGKMDRKGKEKTPTKTESSKGNMPITINDLTISPAQVEMPALLTYWGWALPEPVRPVLLTAMGDVFAQGDSGKVYLVDTVKGEVVEVAADGASFQSLMTDAAFVTARMFPSQVVQLRAAGLQLGTSQVYSHKMPMVLGGADEVSNFEVVDAAVHVNVAGQIHRQVKDLPDGASIGKIEIKR